MKYLPKPDRVHDSRVGYAQSTTAKQEPLKPGNVRTVDVGMANNVGVRVTAVNGKGPGYVSVAAVAQLTEPVVNLWNGSNGDGVMFLATDGGRVHLATSVECDVIVDVFGRS